MANPIIQALHNSLQLVVGFLDRIEEVPASLFDGKSREAHIVCKVRSPGKVDVVTVKFDISKGLYLPKFQNHFVIIPVSLTIFNNKLYYKAFDLPISLQKEYMAEFPLVPFDFDQAA